MMHSRLSESGTQTPPSPKSLSSMAISRPVGTVALTAVALVLGLLFLGRLPVDLLPQIDYPHLRVVVNYAGVPPEVIEEQLTRPLERNLAATENLVEIHGRASEGRTYIEMFFDFETDIDVALQDAARQLERARTELPPGIDPPRLMKMDPSQQPIFEMAVRSATRSEIEVRQWVDQMLAPQLLSIPGVGTIDIAGGMEREIDVVADPERLRSYNLTLQSVSNLLQARSVDHPAGQVTSPDYDIMARTETRFRSARDVAETRIPVGNATQTIRLSDIARVTDSHREQRLFARLNGERAVQVSVMKQPRTNTPEVIERMERRLDELVASGFIPGDMEFEVFTNESFFINAAIRSVSSAVILGGLLAVFIMVFFLGSIRRSAIIALTIPVSIIATFFLMSVSGLTLNIMSLGGLALGIGLLIDNAIVMLENITRHEQEHTESSESPALSGSREVQPAIVAGTMTNLAAVVPFLLVTGLAALLFRELILTIGFAIVVSLLAALTLVPALTARLSTIRWSSGLERTAPLRWFTQAFESTRNAYKKTLLVFISHRYLLLSAAIVLFAASLWLLRTKSTEFLPPVDDGRITMRFVLPAGTSLEPTNEAARALEDLLSDMPHVQTVYLTAGGYFRGGQQSLRSGMIDGVVQLVPLSQRRGYSADAWVSEFSSRTAELGLPFIQQRVRGPRLPGLRTGLAETDIAIGVAGSDLDILEQQARTVYRRLEGLPGIANMQIGREGRASHLMVRVDEQRARTHGVTEQDLALLIHNAVDGIVPTQFVEGGFEYNVRLRLPREITGSTEGLGRIPVINAARQTLPLASLARFEETTGPAHIERFNQIRVVWVHITVNTAQTTVGEAAASIQNELSGLTLPEGYSIIYSGDQQAIEASGRSLQLAIALAVFFVFVVMALLYEKLSSPLVILFTLPFALTGASLALWITGLSLSAPVLLGFIFLTGIIVNNAILLVDAADTRLDFPGIEPHTRTPDGAMTLSRVQQAVAEAGYLRFRPVLMTTLTTMFGMLPLALGLGEGSELLQPLAVTVIGGLLVGSILTLVLLPGVYVIARDIRRLFS